VLWAAWSLGLGLELLVGEPRRLHPLVGFGQQAYRLEAWLNQGRWRIAKGLLAWGVLVGSVVMLAYGLKLALGSWAWGMDGIALWMALGVRSLFGHVQAVITPLDQQQWPAARAALGHIVSRDCDHLDPQGIASATIETTLENGADAIFASLFWFVLGSCYGIGAECVLLHRAANTLDAMWGYRTQRFLQFGRVAARVDDALNYVPARLTALSYALLGQTRQAWQCWRSQAHQHDSPNAGVVMATGAGALNLQVGGMAVYHGQAEARPILGCGRRPYGSDVTRACQLVIRTLALWLVVSSGIILCLTYS
jgi:adenosylcobinamide-phosphate synthase